METVEPEWDDATRALAEALDLYDAEVCPGCNLHPVILNDPQHNAFTFEERLCKVCASQDTYGRVVASRDDEWTEQHKNAKPNEARPGDGRHIYLRRMTPDEVEARKNRGRADGRPPRKRPS